MSMMASTGNRKSILIIVENLPVPFDRRVWAEATTLVEAGYDVSVICPALKGYERRRDIIDGVHIYRHPIHEAETGAVGYLREYLGALFWQVRLAFRVWRERGVDAIHACNPPDLIFLVALLFKLFGKKFVFDHHDLCPELYEAKFNRRGLFWRFLLVAERLTFLCADVSIATNDSYRQIAVKRGRMRPENVFVVRSGPKLEKLKVRPARQDLKRGADLLVGYVGVIGPQEGLDLLVEAAEILKTCYCDLKVHFAIVGSGPALESVKALTVEKGVENLFTFAGRASDDVLLDILSTADVCVNSDRWSAMNDKSTMNKIMEYMALGKPIVQFDLYEGRQSAGDAALYARPDDAADFAVKIATLLKDAEARALMGAIGRRRIVEALSWEHSVPPLLAAYEQVFAMARRHTEHSRGHVVETAGVKAPR